MAVLALGKDKDFIGFAEVYEEKLTGGTSPTNQFNKATDLSDDEVTLIGHSSASGWFSSKPTTIGGLSPEKIASKLAKKYGTNKAALQHLNLLSCEAGLWYNDKPPLAHDVARELTKVGFENVTVHAFTSPIDHRAEGGQIVKIEPDTAKVSVQTFDSQTNYKLQEKVDRVGFKRGPDKLTDEEYETFTKWGHQRTKEHKSPTFQMGETIVSNLSPQECSERLKMATNSFDGVSPPIRTTEAQRHILDQLRQTKKSLKPTGKKFRRLSELEASIHLLDPTKNPEFNEHFKNLLTVAQSDVQGMGSSRDKRTALACLEDCLKKARNAPPIPQARVRSEQQATASPKQPTSSEIRKERRAREKAEAAALREEAKAAALREEAEAAALRERNQRIIDRTQALKKKTRHLTLSTAMNQQCLQIVNTVLSRENKGKFSHEALDKIEPKLKTLERFVNTKEKKVTRHQQSEVERNIERSQDISQRRKPSKPDTRNVIASLNKYIKKRKGEYVKDFLKSFFSFCLYPTLIRAKYKSKEVKINAAERLLEKLTDPTRYHGEFSQDELKALGDGRLKDSIAEDREKPYMKELIKIPEPELIDAGDVNDKTPLVGPYTK